jgi:succinyl-CoA synthetase beta subunit
VKIHEYQGKEILARYGVAIPRGEAVFSASEARAAAARLIAETGNQTVVVKSQIHAGGRGKGTFKEDPDLRGVNVVRGADAAAAIAERMLGKTLVTHQTGKEGKVVGRLLIEQGINIDRELYLGAVVDRGSQRMTLMGCQEGGMEIEDVAARTPEKILKERIDPALGLCGFQARRLAFGLGLSGGATHENAVRLLQALCAAFQAEDASLLEINPLVVTKEGQVMALDAKLNFDDSAESRRTWSKLRDTAEEQASEVEARKHDLSYVNLEGSVGCMVNGAGLAMATMDIIKQFGGEPANFLDVGGGASKERVSAAFKIILSDPAVKGIFINIFGGIVHCDLVAQGVVDAAREVGLKVPLVVRLEGTNVEAGRKIIEQSGLNVTAAADMADGARKIVELIG